MVNEDEDSTNESISIPVNKTKSMKSACVTVIGYESGCEEATTIDTFSIEKQKISGGESDATSSSQEHRLNKNGDDIRDDVPTPPKVNR